MNTEVIVKPIGKWQITIPLEWRILLWFEWNPIRARLENNRVILEAIQKKVLDRDVKQINFSDLNIDTQKSVKKDILSYKNKKKKDFLSHTQIWDV